MTAFGGLAQIVYNERLQTFSPVSIIVAPLEYFAYVMMILFPFERVVQINAQILETGKGMKGAIDIPKLKGALARIDNAIHYEGLDDIFEIEEKYTHCIAIADALPDANKRTGLAVRIEYLSLNDFDLVMDNDLLAEAVRDLTINTITEHDFAGACK